MVTSNQRSACDRWLEETLTQRPPCSMRVDGRPLAEVIGSWKRTHPAATDAAGATLMEKGLYVIIDQRPGSAVRIYQRL